MPGIRMGIEGPTSPFVEKQMQNETLESLVHDVFPPGLEVLTNSTSHIYKDLIPVECENEYPET